MKTLAAPYRVVLAAVALAIVLGCRGAGTGPGAMAAAVVDTPAFTLTATDQDSLGVAPGTAFLLAGKAPLDAEAVKRGLKIVPAVAFAVAPRGENTLLIRPAGPLVRNRVYRVAFDPGGGARAYEWAFQVRTPFRVLSSLPADQATQVPVDSGIEVTFSHENFTAAEAGRHFRIAPAVKGRFEKHKRVLVFVPAKLEHARIYTVAIGRALPVQGSKERMAADHVFRFETEGKTGPEQPATYLEFRSPMTEIGPEDPPLLRVDASGRLPKSLRAGVFRFPDAVAFLRSLRERDAVPEWSVFARRRFRADTSRLNRVLTFAPIVRKIPTRYEDYPAQVLELPRRLASGFYLVDASLPGAPAQAWLQVSSTAVYVATSPTRSLVWANDLKTKRALSGARVELAGRQFSTRTSARGVALFETPAPLDQGRSEGEYFLVTAAGGAQLVAPVRSNLYDWGVGGEEYGWEESGEGNGQYWHYLYTDRLLYQPTDTVRFFGFIRDRDRGTTPRTVKVALGRGDYTDYYGQPAVIAQQTVAVSERGMVHGEVRLAGYQTGGYSLTVSCPGFETSAEFSVETYTKPAYRIKITPASKGAFAGDSVAVTIQGEFFDGTPVPYTAMKYGYPRISEKELVTDAQGQAHLTLPASAGEEVDSATLTVSPRGTEMGEITGEATITAFPSAVLLDVETKIGASGRQATVVAKAHRVDLAKFDAEGDAKGGPLAGQIVTARVLRRWYQKVSKGFHTEYDFISKRVRRAEKVEWVRKSEVVARLSGKTDSRGQCAWSFAAKSGQSYEVACEARDDRGRTARASGWVCPWCYYDYDDQARLRRLDADAPVAIGAAVPLSIERRGGQLPLGSGSFLFYAAQDGIRGYSVEEQAAFTHRFAEADVPNVHVSAVWFTGATYAPCGDVNLRFDSEKRRLKIALTPGKPRYRPGEEVDLAVTVTDAAGRPATAEVNLALVDEALWALQGERDEDILQSLYQDVEEGVSETYGSHQPAVPPSEAGGAEAGGEGAGDRHDFADVAFWGFVTTGADGVGRVRFRLPDNITSWRITAQAIGAGLTAGIGRAEIPVSLPFFVEATHAPEYLSADVPYLKFRAFGTALQADQEVRFAVRAPTLGIEAGDPMIGKAFLPSDLLIPRLHAGAHPLTVEGSAGAYRDALTHTLQVVDSRMEREESEFARLEPGIRLQGAGAGLTRLLFCDRNRGSLYGDLVDLCWTYGARADQQVARARAWALRAEYFGEKEEDPQRFNPALYQRNDGGISLLPYAESDPVLTAKVAGAAPDLFDRKAVATYLYKVLSKRDTDRRDSSAAVFGLAALREPVLPLVGLGAAGNDSVERLFLALAAAHLGAKESARVELARVLRAHGEELKPMRRIRAGKDQDDILEATALAAALAAMLGVEEHDALWQYVRKNRTTDIVTDLDAILYLASALPAASPEPARFTYRIGERTETKALKEGETFRLQVTPEDLARITFSGIEGNVGVVSTFRRPFRPAEARQDAALRLEREYQVDGRSTTEVKENQLVKVVLTCTFGPRALDGTYQVADLLPSGLQVLSRSPRWEDHERDTLSYPYNLEGQRASFLVWKREKPVTITYLARPAAKGTYVAEPAMLQSLSSRQSLTLSSSSTLRVR